MAVINLNVGLLGHVDSGKTSIAKALSVISSTACFDKNPQSQERGITIDLGFSSFITDLPDRLKQVDEKLEKIQFTLVDCPGHASLIKTIIGGAQIIDMMILVIDITKGVQTQTAECLIIGEITSRPLVVLLNKTDLIEPDKKAATIEKVKKKMISTLASTVFKGSPVVAISASPGGPNRSPEGLPEVIDILKEMAFIPERFPDKPMVFSLDHCFSIKGKGTVMTGTILQGTIKVNDDIEIPALKIVKKVKSIQIYKKNVDKAIQGDRVGVCVTQFDPKLLERGVACLPGYLSSLYAAVVSLSRVKYYKMKIATNSKFHISIGFETVLGKLTLFSHRTAREESEFGTDEEYAFESELEEVENTQGTFKKMFGLLEFERPVIGCNNNLVIGSKLDVDVHTNSCRLAFHGRVLMSIQDKNYQESVLPKLKIFKIKEKTGTIQRMVNDHEVIAQSIFRKETKMQLFMNFKVSFSTGEVGIIESSFGQSGKVKIRLPDGLKPETVSILSKKKNRNTSDKENCITSEPVRITLRFKKFIFGKEKRIFPT